MWSVECGIRSVESSRDGGRSTPLGLPQWIHVWQLPVPAAPVTTGSGSPLPCGEARHREWAARANDSVPYLMAIRCRPTGVNTVETPYSSKMPGLWKTIHPLSLQCTELAICRAVPITSSEPPELARGSPGRKTPHRFNRLAVIARRRCDPAPCTCRPAPGQATDRSWG